VWKRKEKSPSLLGERVVHPMSPTKPKVSALEKPPTSLGRGKFPPQSREDPETIFPENPRGVGDPKISKKE